MNDAGELAGIGCVLVVFIAGALLFIALWLGAIGLGLGLMWRVARWAGGF